MGEKNSGRWSYPEFTREASRRFLPGLFVEGNNGASQAEKYPGSKLSAIRGLKKW